ncbi:MAG: transglutaminase domain-containing protein [Bacteroidota bacterium]|nr:transglutaminase domain-containing protein [Bacteroidota bacterium]
MLSSVSDLYSWYASLVKEVNNSNDVLVAKVKGLVQGKNSDEEKIKSVYYWVQDNIRYIAFENGIAGFKPEAAHNVYNNKYGDCKGMANLTKEMLKLAGYDARLTWIGTNKIAYNYAIPTLAADNHMICTVFLNGKKIYLDGTEKFISLDENAERIQGRQVLIENGTNYILDSIPVADKFRNKVSTEILLKMMEGNKLAGNFTTTLNGEAKTGLLYSINHTPTDKRRILLEKVITNGNKSLFIDNIQNSSLVVREMPFVISCDYTALNKVSVFESDVYVELEHEYYFKDFTIKPERVSDIVFDEKILRTSKVSLSVPTGYKISHLPANYEVLHEAFSFKVSFAQKNGMVHYNNEISVTKGIIGKEDFKAWNDAIQGLKKAYNDKLVLTKI